MEKNYNIESEKMYKMEMIKDYKLNREMNVYDRKDKKSEFLEDRDLFNKFSNVYEQLDISNFPSVSNDNEFNLGMPIYNTQIFNNKKSLLSTPFMTESDNTKFKSINYTLDNNNMYEEIDFNNTTNIENTSNISIDNFTDMAYNNNNNSSKTNSLCKIEKEITEFEYIININKKLDFLVDVSSPYALGYVWKVLILLCKNPSLDKLLKLLNVRNKDYLINDLKNYSELFEKNGNIQIIIPDESSQVINSNFIIKIEDAYKIKIINSNKINENKVRINLNYNFDIEFPEEYGTYIIHDYMLNYNKNKFKFLQSSNIPITYISKNNIVLIEIPICYGNVLGFIYDINNENLLEFPYDLIMENKSIDYVAAKLIIPKINKKNKILYSKKYENELQNIHLGELRYSKLYNVEIVTDINLDIKITTEKVYLENKERQVIDLININHKCYFYIKNLETSKLLINGMIHY
jgi:hypothetical protein